MWILDSYRKNVKSSLTFLKKDELMQEREQSLDEKTRLHSAQKRRRRGWKIMYIFMNIAAGCGIVELFCFISKC
ncbi:hypothetical protein SKAU_G00160970 [Synaphobranchus kaupii]|uniref:Uncharacterized protein n=1 Tax=Synaphobranchus kaupii TaxID=118154 RepID=A0A9Q1FIH6_SYNKA|nr:hypothetical protein SKAU_G00160970 [Synaphobranchus kaupii]